ncbi:hypothetical protein N7462_008852 [Penicillium macrosclerotiorum]|uniref:uncharacterized protein n=1 Tax=Penicillium macrosclerotiorum TaxID=303699 RepID=UPI0025477596|nr:uncharacterized protein N7462_008852 [Penicillium macrosclerotiorum]KAJ5675955.1 hypothetical protein N7462_008852 [Penicillium macrosclerotiorum]
MSDTKDLSALTAGKDASFAHCEHTRDDVPELATLEITYDESGIKGILKSPYVCGAALLASIGGFSFGYDQGVISLILVMPQFTVQFPQVDESNPHYGFNKGFMTGMLELGAFVGCLLFPYLADKISRKWGLSVATTFFCIGAVIQTASQNYDSLVAGRFIGGIGVGALAMGAPLYISEIAPPNLRGSLMVLEAISIVIGAIVAYWITYGTRDISGEWAFRLPFLLQMVPALMVGAGIHFFPFSPRWLALRNRNQDSLQSLAKLRRLPTSDEKVQLEWRGILTEDRFQKQILQNQHPNTGPLMMELKQWIDLFRPKYVRRTFVAMAVAFFQQFSGVNAFVYYAPTFFIQLGQDYNMSLILSGLINVCQFVGSVPIIVYMDKIGRRNIAIYGAFLMAVPHLIMSGLFAKFSSNWDTHKGVGWLGVSLIYVYIFAYSLSYGPLGWVLPAEVFPSSKRAKGVGIATATNWLANFIIGTIVPQMLESIGWGTFLFFGVWCIIAGVFSFFFVPETANKSLEQVAAVFGDNLQAYEEDLRRQAVLEVWAETGGPDEVRDP